MRRIAAILVLVFLVSNLVVLAPPALAQDGTILVKSSDVHAQFPDGIAFEIAAQTVAPATIKEIKLDMKVKGSGRGSYAYLDFTPDTSVTGKYLLRTGGAQYKPVGSLFEYRFLITDSAGRILETEPATFLYLDNRFTWDKVSQGVVEVYYHGSARERAQTVLKASVEAISKMGALLGVTREQPIRVIGYNSPAEMAPALPFQAKAVQTELLTQGQAWHEYGVLLELISDPLADGVAGHELTHMLVDDAAKGAYVNIPSWLNEGLAEYGNANPGYSYDVIMAKAIAAGQLLPLRHMQSPPGIPQQTLLFYGQSRSVVRYLVNTYGDAKLKDLFGAFRQGLPIDEALKKTYGFDQDGLDNAWRVSLNLPPLTAAPTSIPIPSITSTVPRPGPLPQAPASSGINIWLIVGIVGAGILIGVIAWIIIARGRSKSTGS
ncbi:MAG: peptidase MA family metallohydrolase [Dehalococcoidales bacterium]|nr:peptidase MA family metallohydrolase [Dehalococcoidales bacterium]